MRPGHNEHGVTKQVETLTGSASPAIPDRSSGLMGFIHQFNLPPSAVGIAQT